MSYAEGDAPGEVTPRYLQSTESADDVRGFDVADIVGVDTTTPVP